MKNAQAILSLIYGKVISPGPAGLSVSNFTLALGGREYVEVIQFLFDAINSQQTLTEIDCQHVFSCYFFLSHLSGEKVERLMAQFIMSSMKLFKET